jgi:hypothetical protein
MRNDRAGPLSCYIPALIAHRITQDDFLEVAPMKSSLVFAMAIALFASAPVLARQTGADASSSDSAKMTYASAAAGFGDEAASRSWEMTDVKTELDGKLDSKSARVGGRVVLKTAEKVQTSDGTVIPRGSRIVGHITEVQAHNNDRAIAQIAIAFDHVELKNGQSVAVHSLIRTVRPSGSVSTLNSMDNDDMMSTLGGDRMGGGRTLGAVLGSGGASSNAPSQAGGIGGASAGGISGSSVDRTGGAVAGTDIGANAGANTNLGTGVNANTEGAVQLAGHGDAPIQGGAHAAAAERSVPHPTGIPGVALAGSSTASGLLIEGDRKDLEFVSGTRFELGLIADR